MDLFEVVGGGKSREWRGTQTGQVLGVVGRVVISTRSFSFGDGSSEDLKMLIIVTVVMTDCRTLKIWTFEV